MSFYIFLPNLGGNSEKKFSIVLPLLFALILLLAGCGIAKPPSESEIENYLTEDFYTIYVDGTPILLECNGIAIERRQNNDKENIISLGIRSYFDILPHDPRLLHRGFLCKFGLLFKQ